MCVRGREDMEGKGREGSVWKGGSDDELDDQTLLQKDKLKVI